MRRRAGFTIVELLVAMALILFMMAILSEAFSAGLKTFRDLKATADLAERLRSASSIIRRELAADHFDGKRRLSQPDFWGPGAGSPPPEGFFRLYQGSPPSATAGAAYFFEGQDPDETGSNRARMLNSCRATDHMLHFTVKLRGNARDDFFSAGDIPAGSPLLTSPLYRGERHYQEGTETTYRSQWAEVAYFLRPTTDSTKATATNPGGIPLYALHRRQWLLVPDNGLLTDAALASTTVNGNPRDYLEMSARQATTGNALYFNNPRDVTMPVRRMGMNATGNPISNPTIYAGLQATTGTYPTMHEDEIRGVTGTLPNTYEGSDLLLTDVVSFEVRLLLFDSQQLNKGFENLYDLVGVRGLPNNTTPRAAAMRYQTNNPNFKQAGPMVFDTWSAYAEKTSPAGGPFDYSTWNTTGTNQSIPLFARGAANAVAPTLIRPTAIQITLRVWDSKTEQTRQITIIQDL